MSEDKESGIKIVCENRKARHNYFIEERFEAGLVLTGPEVKSLRDAKANLQDSYAIFKNGELFLLNAHISPYAQGARENLDPERSRKLLLHKSEIAKLFGKLEIRGYSLIPLKLYFKKGIAKVEVALAKGKKAHDKRDSTKEKETKREMARAMRKNR